MCPHTITVQAASTMNLYGGVQASTVSETYQCLIVHKSELVAGPDAKEVVSRTQIYIPSSCAAITEQDIITLSDNTTPHIVLVDKYSDDKGQHNVVIHCG
jgi:hypothetical protein